MATDAYKVKKDTSIPRALRLIEEDEIQGKIYETETLPYAEGDYVLASEISPPVLERVENGELDDFLEPVSGDEAEQARIFAERAGRFSTVIPEHENEAHIQQQYGHEVVPRQQEIELKSAGAEADAARVEALKADGADERPGLTAAEVPSLVEASNEGKTVVADAEPVEVPAGTEQPPGLLVGEDLASAREADTEAQPRRRRPGRSQSQSSSSSSSEGSSSEQS